MKIKTRKSKFWNLLKIIYPGIKMKEMWLTFGTTIWTPGFISNDLVIHEQVHINQQKNWRRAIWWWIKYTLSPKFRLYQEIPAYRAQYEQLKMVYKNREDWHKIRESIAKIMSGEKYNHMVNYPTALHWINAEPNEVYDAIKFNNPSLKTRLEIWYGSKSKCCHAPTYYDAGYDRTRCGKCDQRN